MKRILLLLTVTAVMAFMLAPAAWAQVWPGYEPAPAPAPAPVPAPAPAPAPEMMAPAPAPAPQPKAEPKAMPKPKDLPKTGGPALLPLGAAVAASLGLFSAGAVYLRRRR
jgi:hypothetical protein